MGKLGIGVPSSGHLLSTGSSHTAAPSEDDHAAWGAGTVGERSASQDEALPFSQVVSASGLTLTCAQLTQRADKHL